MHRAHGLSPFFLEFLIKHALRRDWLDAADAFYTLKNFRFL